MHMFKTWSCLFPDEMSMLITAVHLALCGGFFIWRVSNDRSLEIPHMRVRVGRLEEVNKAMPTYCMRSMQQDSDFSQ